MLEQLRGEAAAGLRGSVAGRYDVIGGAYNFTVQFLYGCGNRHSFTDISPLPPTPAPTRPPTLTLTANPTNVEYNTATTLTWSSANTTSCTASDAWSGAKSVSGSQSSAALTAASNTFTLVCNGPGGSVTKSAVVTTTPAPTVTLTASVNGDAYTGVNRTIDAGDTVRVKWDSDNADTCTSSDFATSNAADGADVDVVEPTLGTSKGYSVTCTRGSRTAFDTLTVTNRGQAPTLTPSNSVVKAGGRTVIGYDLKGNASCVLRSTDSTVNGIVVTQNGTRQTGVLTSATRYTIDCGLGKSASVVVNITGKIQEQ
ncbi:hypothetical protein A3C89_02555 [Candidatus Kaiserbacteria bacterium RIFCSPHIGHO2_02_FULL_50_50]|uniref:Uncharacterized protein n=1 Tax=Candidatus Kaiserbacteria bacterium RIFCSPHIGHO2_02_FULL_50_50 TaxID=1798492 RepID=A0A1F6DD86_9BACT|nr:MAG: hypothetical protein A3C89_02555 [Candidatus Kaiserbacteria bacterium RIFCSPHIGHO2_02_FULL_50_50]OGG88175.1 MAG: hypothetical protein A3G62_00250 [Candidatus Kaiserbacteria bacterium RIFCSPLOWO2_12_FULL_50_10]